MKTLVLALTAAALVAGAADAQGHPGWGRDQGAAHHWNRGERMGYNDWRGAQPVDYRAHHLRAPPRGYEWRESNGQYVLAAVATGLIASIILANGH
jgi:Ni/Co efflux regulator RcnB